MSKDNSTEEFDPLAGGKEMKTEAVSFGKPKDFIRGTYTNYKDVPGKNGNVKLYEMIGQMGSFHRVSQDDEGNNVVSPDKTDIVPGDFYNVWGGKDAIDDGYRKSKPGDEVGIQFVEAKKSQTKGNKPFKIFRFVNFGPDASYKGEGAADMAAVEEVFPGSEDVEDGAGF